MDQSDASATKELAPDSTSSSSKKVEDEEASLPEDVTGVYLTCNPIEDANESNLWGCSLFKKDDSLFNADTSWVISAVDKNTAAEIPVEFKMTPESDKWQIQFVLPPEAVSGSFELVVKVQANGQALSNETPLSPGAPVSKSNPVDDETSTKTASACGQNDLSCMAKKTYCTAKELEDHVTDKNKTKVVDELSALIQVVGKCPFRSVKDAAPVMENFLSVITSASLANVKDHAKALASAIKKKADAWNIPLPSCHQQQ